MTHFGTTFKKATMALPIVAVKNEALIFREWKVGDQLIKRGIFDILEPSDDKSLLEPDIMLIPLLMFTEGCQRLGYGGGHYDRTIDLYKKN
mmetsp:Transcript_41020/g.39542  ORF Transcript_41020/g.39542 Transcript_41020/m.39542 type:complete len:91 (+) Transcript_41020:264-536(+)